MTGGVRYFALVKPDKFATIEHDVGAAASEQFLVEFANLLQGAPAIRRTSPAASAA